MFVLTRVLRVEIGGGWPEMPGMMAGGAIHRGPRSPRRHSLWFFLATYSRVV